MTLELFDISYSSVGKESAYNAGYLGSVPGLGRSPGEGNGTPFQYSCLQNPKDRGVWQATVHWVARVGHDLSVMKNTNTNQIDILLLDNLIIWYKFKVKSESEVAQSCPTLCDPMDCSLPGSYLHGILQARVLEWGAISFSRGSSRPRDRTRVSHIPGRRFNL